MSNLALQSSLDLLQRLRGLLADFAQREQVLVRSLNSRRTAIERRFGAETGEAGLAEEIAAARAALEEQEEHARAAFAARRERIEFVHGQTFRGVPRQARGAREGWLGELQRRLRTAEGQRSASQRATRHFAADQAARLTAVHARVGGLQAFARAHLPRRGLAPAEALPPPGDDAEEEKLLGALEETVAAAEGHLAGYQLFPLPRFFRAAPLVLWAIIAALMGVGVAWGLGLHGPAWPAGGAAAVVIFGGAVALQQMGARKARPAVREFQATLAASVALYQAASAGSTAVAELKKVAAEEEFEREKTAINEQWERAGAVEKQFATEARAKLAAQLARLQARLARLSHTRLKALAASRFTALGRMEEQGRARLAEAAGEGERARAEFLADEAAKWQALVAAWEQEARPLWQAIAALEAEAGARFVAWEPGVAEAWAPAAEFPAAVKIAQLDVHAAELVEALPRDPRLALPGPEHFTLPLALTFPNQGSLLFETRDAAGATVNGCLNNLILRLLTLAPPGKITFTIVDPVGLGQNFAGLMHLTDYEEGLINRRIWTQPNQIEERLSELNEHLEKVIQMYLRNEYATITEYNAQAGSVAEKYHFLVAADFPAGFSETAARRLQSIALSGPRCGVFTLLHWDRRRPLPEGLVADDLRRNSIVLTSEQGRVALPLLPAGPGVAFVLDPPAPSDLAAALIHRIGKASVDSSRVEVPFAQIAPNPEELWESTTTQELRVPIGRTGATKLQYLAIGKGTRQHALFAGKTGSGKSTLFHVIITNLTLWCSPEQVEFYLIDFKKGVEFKCYADQRLPHARVVAIESDREFALSVLQRVDEELRRRGDLFRKLGVQDVAGYQRVTAASGGAREPMPRSLLIIDEFQEFFTEDDVIAQNASLLFDRIVRQGRAFGIHVLLGSQTLGGAYTLARATLGQMVIRVALQCNEADAYLIMDENNAAPRLLSRPGEGIYNDSAGATEGNSPFQVVWLADEERDRWLRLVRDKAARQEMKFPSPIVFEGNSPAEVRDNDLLSRSLALAAPGPTAAPRCWLGAPNSIKGPTEAVFQRQSGNNLLIVGQHEEGTLTMLGLALLALAAQYPPGHARFVFFLSAAPGSAEALFIEQIADARPGDFQVVQPPESPAALGELAAELTARLGDEAGSTSAKPIFVFIQGLHRFKKFRQEEDFSFSASEETTASPGAQFQELMLEGSAHGIHLLAAVDTFNSVNRFINRKALSEWEMRVVFQMSANDSASLIDSPQASNLGLHRALFYNERAGSLETFRPYAMPNEAWLGETATHLARQTAPVS